MSCPGICTMNITSDEGTHNLLDVSDTIYTAFDILINCFLAQALAWFGFLGNILNICVLSQQGMRDTTNLLLLYLAVSDLIFSILTIAYRIQNIVFYVDRHLSVTILSYYYEIFDNIKYTALFSGTYLITMLSVERMFAVCFPFQVSRIVTRFRIKICAFIITFIIFVIQLPLYGLTYLDLYIVDNATEMRRYVTNFTLNNYDFLKNFYLSTFVNVYSMVIPIVIVMVCSIMTITTIKMSFKNTRKLSTNSQLKRTKEIRSVKLSLVLSTSLISLVLVPSGCIETVLITNRPSVHLSEKAYRLLFSSDQILYIMNSSCNFILYVLTSQKFTKTLTKMFVLKK
ncbi:growth hormone secretagogue receptor type 1-like [Biomphalaria glabrata]|uniref:Growth hormone secretagogue receptor type 1-like n=1 Tax=Biomphalaria glabrata TaxID=6526 RepID=A0A9W2YDM6_BIOGL|nr:growth hormone secretagogue receptor type 1-like [Biomphalaria glabrata]